ncbi:MAG: phosphotransferase enzyme family protein [Gammaproteobacteria bacterium]
MTSQQEHLLALAGQFKIDAKEVTPLGSGLINHTWSIRSGSGKQYVLQRMHEMFPASINTDIEAVTAHLDHHGFVTPRLLRTDDEQLSLENDSGNWRMMTFVDGVSLNALESSSQAREAGALLGRFHEIVASLDHQFSNTRPCVHDTARHLASLEEQVANCGDHWNYEQIRPLGDRILAAAAELPALPAMPDRIVHGDPKINNIIFDRSSGVALCLVDLDTLGRMPLPLELGDAFRSWCNPAGEDSTKTGFSLDFFESAVSGYASSSEQWIGEVEWQSIVAATRTILVELAARFCADALAEQYFGWDPDRFSSRSEHNRVRAEGQLATAAVLDSLSSEAEDIVARVFS